MAKKGARPQAGKQKRRHGPQLSQQDLPAHPVDKALNIPRAIADNYGGSPSSPLEVASALRVQPSSGTFRTLVSASNAYGLTANNGAGIEVTPLGSRILHPTVDGDDLAAEREALLKPRILREFLQRYDDSPIPRETIAQNVLATMGVPPERTETALRSILGQAERLGLTKDINGKKYVYLKGIQVQPATAEPDHEEGAPSPMNGEVVSAPVNPSPAVSGGATAAPVDSRLKRVFITHGKNRAFVDPIRELLKFGELEAVVSTEKPTVSQPVPKKIMEEMRACGAAIIHVEGERKLIDPDTKEQVMLNENVLIEIGAAMALYGERFILLVRSGVKLPSNLQGLYEVRYVGDRLDGEETIKLLEAIRDLKTRPLP